MYAHLLYAVVRSGEWGSVSVFCGNKLLWAQDSTERHRAKNIALPLLGSVAGMLRVLVEKHKFW